MSNKKEKKQIIDIFIPNLGKTNTDNGGDL